MSRPILNIVFGVVLAAAICVVGCGDDDNPVNPPHGEWYFRHSDMIDDLYDVVWNGSEFKAVGWHASILSSPDGITWSLQSTPAGTTDGDVLKAIAWSTSQHRFVAVGDQNLVIASGDGIIWEKRASGLPDYCDFTDVQWFNDKFYAIGDAGQITSSDGLTWIPDSSAAPFDQLAVSDTLLIGVGYGGIWSTTNGTHWIQRDSGDFLLQGAGWYSAGQTWVAVGHLGRMATSTNGIQWTGIETDSSDVSSLFGVADTGDRCLVVGNNNGPGLILSSVDGSTWSRQVIGPTWLRAIAVSDKRTVIVGYAGTILSTE